MVKIVKPKRSMSRKSDWHPEQGLISAVLNESDHVTPFERGVTVDWFHSYRDEWKFIERQVKKTRQTPSVTFFLRRFTDFEIVRVYDVESLIDEVKEAHAKYELLTIVNDIVEEIDEGGKSPTALLGDTERMLNKIRTQTDGTFNESDAVSGWRESYSAAKIFIERQERSVNGMTGIPTTWPTLDDITGGYGDGEYWIIASRLGGGKTWSLIQGSCAAIMSGYTVQYDTMEQSRTQIQMRAHNLLSGKFGKHVFASHDLRRGKGFDLREYHKFLREMERRIKGRLFIDDTPRGKVTVANIAAQIERNQPHVVYIDYLGLMNKHKGDWGAMAQVSADLQGLAKTYNVPVIVASQLSRVGVGKEPPGPEALSESDSIGHDADGLVTMASQSYRVKKFRLAKFRHGPDGIRWYCLVDPKRGMYKEITGDEAHDIRDEDEINNDV